MELAFEDRLNIDQQPQKLVSILLLMELAFEVASMAKRRKMVLDVSILLLMELAFEVSSKTRISVI